MAHRQPHPLRVVPVPWKVDIRLPGKGDSNSHGARPVRQKHRWTRTSRLSIKNSLSLCHAVPDHLLRPRDKRPAPPRDHDTVMQKDCTRETLSNVNTGTQVNTSIFLRPCWHLSVSKFVSDIDVETLERRSEVANCDEALPPSWGYPSDRSTGVPRS